MLGVKIIPGRAHPGPHHRQGVKIIPGRAHPGPRHRAQSAKERWPRHRARSAKIAGRPETVTEVLGVGEGRGPLLHRVLPAAAPQNLRHRQNLSEIILVGTLCVMHRCVKKH
jgi:hypothetical protein